MLKNFINNYYVASASSESFDLVNPATGRVAGQSPNSTAGACTAASMRPGRRRRPGGG
ncbi:hypothetical protein QJS66_15160 [Kocuria rhizophila]|nr:hypothetical protein QJS66_15160 [Kocuria rhizophila]